MVTKKNVLIWLLILSFTLAVAGLANAAELQGAAKISLDNSKVIWGQPLKATVNWNLNVNGKDLNLNKTYSIPFPTQSFQMLLQSMGLNPSQPTNPITQPSVNNPTDTTGQIVLSVDEQKMLDLVNKERTSRGLVALKINPTLTKVARAHSQDMITRNFFNHNNPDGKTPFDRMKAAGITYRTAGENIAGASSVETAHNNLMNSPGHRANILNPNFTEIGIGIVNGGKYGKMYTQNFIGN